MFSLCCGEKSVEKVFEPVLVDNLKIRGVSLIPTKLLRGPQPTPGPVPIPLPSVTPPTPDLTPEEIAKIQANLVSIRAFIKDLWQQQSQIITAVWSKLQAMVNETKPSSQNKLADIFENLLEVGAFITAIGALIPGVDIICGPAAIILGTTATLLCQNAKDMAGITDDDISATTATHFEINDANYYANDKAVGYYHDFTNYCRDYIFTSKYTTTQTATLRDLINGVFPLPGSTTYNKWLHLVARTFRRKIVLPEIQKGSYQFLDLYFIEDRIHGEHGHVEHGHVYQPMAANGGIWGIQRDRPYNVDNLGKNAGIWSNTEVVHFHECTQYDITGNSDTDLTSSWLSATGEFISKVPHVYIYPWAIDNAYVHTQKYFIIQGTAKMRDDQNAPKYNVGDANFLNWLFIDDGVGNITNPDGVAFRYEVLRLSATMGGGADLFSHAAQISDDLVDVDLNTKWIASCKDYLYGPEDSRDINALFHVYTGDLLLRNTPQPN